MPKGDEAALIAAAVAGRSLAQIAATAQVSPSTVQRRLKDPDIVAAVREGRSQQRREAVRQLNNELQSAIERLGQLLAHEDPNVVLRAAGMVLGNAHKFTMAIEFDERLQSLEADRGS